ncbi:prepilin-type N-terminal cleavage/methylation domain-containing protein [Actinokineospora alba]|uniref:Prepilin-type N-terminal cleavage/methylation domain-containing protein n=1 Tax=Actinokineospora alba TaxID=504798 RepID=A0A1H0ETB9_9PSEU|nr:prepilin-type N-terminal cleavage/methylation domain-containing protein [Actinokineospora alba]TDP69217.1 prepilin-type N-terminal cleavage/methylation domain-containing protein [Actinokineospora alba]SDI21676.1 prepilin-type N-terminal cleavage/methylation domain-containing protein [Actinokineospora alba]SDN85611.1 prepilin-type N-terminal cleavage/methylation domain-containing protein [Actinokineospora alba]
MHLTRRDRDDAGFTLVELLMAIVILGVISVPLAGLIIAGLRQSASASARLQLSHDSQISATYFGQDVSTVGIRDYAAAHGLTGVAFKPSIQLDAAFDAGGHVCGTAATPTAKIRLLSERWDNSAAAPASSVDVVAYYLVPVGPVSELHRIKCSGGTVADVIVAHYVDPATLAVDCGGACDTAAVPQRVTMSFTVATANADPYVISLNGQRRQT